MQKPFRPNAIKEIPMSKINNFQLMKLAGLISASLSLTACQNSGIKERKGAGIGAFVGTVFGATLDKDNQGRGAVAGLIFGTLIGKKIGASMNSNDRARRTTALENNRTNQPLAWTNPDSGNKYRVTPKRTYKSANNVPCREFETEAFIRGERKEYTGKACRDNNGNWIEKKS